MPDAEATAAWGSACLTYTKDQSEQLYELMDSNGWDIPRCIGALCFCDVIRIDKSTVPLVIHFMEKLQAWKVIEGRDFNRIWKAMQNHDSQFYTEVCPQ